jgi:XTP/dITP diphosphohydrolase
MKAMREIIVATGNPGKLREIQAVLGGLPVSVKSLAEFPTVDEPVEDGATFAANARLKARYYAAAFNTWCLADDSGLVVDALGGEPGVHSARYAADQVPAGSGRDVIDPANNAKLLDELANIADADRTARFVCHLALADNTGEILIEAHGTIEGRIGYKPAGENGFGYDPLFVLPALGCTTAQLPPKQKNAISHRGQATRQFRSLLEMLLVRLAGE